MAVVAEFTIPPEALPGGTALETMSEVTIDLERIVPTSESALPFFWVMGERSAAFIERLQDHPEINDVRVLAEVPGAALVEATWTPDAAVVNGIKKLRATIMQATGTAEAWRFQVRANDRERLVEFQRIFLEQDIPVRLQRIYNFSEIVETGRPLTDQQRETLLVAYEEGYFDQPRGITQEGLAEHFDVSSRAIGNRLRRGVRNIVANTLLDPADATSQEAK